MISSDNFFPFHFLKLDKFYKKKNSAMDCWGVWPRGDFVDGQRDGQEQGVPVRDGMLPAE